MLNLDVMVSVDTALLHLAGSLDMPTFGLIPSFNTDWRWMLDRVNTPWYPQMTLYRQDRERSWAPTLARLRSDLELTVKAHDPIFTRSYNPASDAHSNAYEVAAALD